MNRKMMWGGGCCLLLSFLSGVPHGQGAEPKIRTTVAPEDDHDGDGWDDLWAALFGDTVDLSKPDADVNGDGVSDYEAMLRWQDPHAAVTPPARDAAADAAARRESAERKRAEHARLRALLKPWINRGVRDADGRPSTRKAVHAAKRARLAAKAPQRAAESAKRRERVESWMESHAESYAEKGITDRPVDVIDGRPVFYKGQALEPALAMGVLDLWPGGTSLLDLTGAGVTMAMWDEGRVLDSHEQFAGAGGPRITNIDNMPLNDHATSVAAALCGGGDPTILDPPGFYNPFTTRELGRGAAYEATVRAYDTFDDVNEMADLQDEMLGICLSNHSYGEKSGWEFENGGWVWYGDPTVNPLEDWKFGFYAPNVCDEIDEIVYLKSTYLPVFATGNDGNTGDSHGPAEDPFNPGHSFSITHTVFGPPPTTATTVRRIDGGEFGFDTLRPQACCKNVLTVGSGNNSTIQNGPGGGFGPTDDGRIKPDVYTEGDFVVSASIFVDPDPFIGPYGDYKGSSYSTALLTGTLGLLAQRYEDLHGAGRRPLASTLRALAIQGAANDNPGPTYDSGWGHFITSTQSGIVEDDGAPAVMLSHPHIKETRIGNDPDNSLIEFTVVRGANAPIAFQNRLVVTICWSDPSGPAPTNPSVDPSQLMLVNDLDLRVVHPDGTTVEMPWVLDPANPAAAATKGDNFRDNVEQVEILNPVQGEYTVRITPKAGTTLVDEDGDPAEQDLSILVSGNVAFTVPFRVLLFEETDIDEHTLTFSSAVGGIYQIERSSDLVQWSAEPFEIHATKRITAVPLDVTPGASREYFRVRQLQ